MTNLRLIPTDVPAAIADPVVHEKSAPRRYAAAVACAVGFLVLLAVPELDITIPFLFDSDLASSQVLLMLATSFVLAAVAVSYDVVFGYAGMLHAGQSMFFGIGVYFTNIWMSDGVPLVLAAALATLLATSIGFCVGALSLRTQALAFTMVTLAFCEAFYTLLITDPFDIFGGEQGLPLAYEQVPDKLLDARDVRWLYWLALMTVVVVAALAWIVTRSRCGRVWQAVRENEERAEMVGLRPYSYKLLAFGFSSFLAALSGCIYLVVVRSANPAAASVEFGLAMIVMVTIGGRGRIWGAALGGFLYGLLTLRLPAIVGGTSPTADRSLIARLFSEPLVVLGVAFVLVVLFTPSGIAGAMRTKRPRR